jgi:predicted TIM-barrel fold metal-dependent hydrolase
MWRLDDHYLQFGDEIPYLNKLPSEYIRDQFYFTTQPLGHTARNGAHLAQALEMVGPDSVMYSADLPHTDFDPPEELLNRIRSHFDAETVRGIMGETAADLFGFDY